MYNDDPIDKINDNINYTEGMLREKFLTLHQDLKAMLKEMLYFYSSQNKILQRTLLESIPQISLDYQSLDLVNLEKDSFIVQGNLNKIKEHILNKNPNIKVSQIDYKTTFNDLLGILPTKEDKVLILLNSVLTDNEIISSITKAIYEKTVKVCFGKDSNKKEVNLSYEKSQIILALEDIRQLYKQEINFPVFTYKNGGKF